jgi:DDE superfamily endonuclease
MVGYSGMRGIPDEVEFTKPRLAQAMIARALAAGVPFAWFTADEIYGQAKFLTAGYADGVLHVTIPASPKAQARRVKVTHAAGGSRVVPGSTVQPGEAPAGSTGGGG